jgi:nitrate reductase gamma subunit
VFIYTRVYLLQLSHGTHTLLSPQQRKPMQARTFSTVDDNLLLLLLLLLLLSALYCSSAATIFQDHRAAFKSSSITKESATGD